MSSTVEIIPSNSPVALCASLNYRQDKQVLWKKKVYTPADVKARKHVQLKDDGQAFSNGLSCQYAFKKDETEKYVKFYALVNNVVKKEQTLTVYVEPQYQTDIRVKEKSVQVDKPEATVGETVKCTVGYRNHKKQKDVPEKDVPQSTKDNVKWKVKVDGKTDRLIVDDEVIRGGNISFKVPKEWAGKEVLLMPYLNKSAESISCKTKITGGGSLFMFIIANELLPNGKLVRKVVVPPSNSVWEYFKGNPYERFGMQSPNPNSMITIGEHAGGFNQSKYLSASSLPKGAPNISGSPQYIDINKALKAGCRIYSPEEIVADLKKLQSESPTSEVKARLGKVINAVANIERETLIEGNIPAEAIMSKTSMNLTKGLRVVNIIGIGFSAYRVEQASELSIKERSVKPIAAQTIREAGGWGMAIVGAKIGAVAGAAIGIETGPGAIITGLIGSVIFGTAGYFGADWVADYIYE
ncbi:MAG: glycine zipper family protein, partial [Bacteroidales bacterium]|nr:glycine zipper family protein [Bacteroidales bacterium]